MNLRIISYVKWCVVMLLLGRGTLHFTDLQPYHVIFNDAELLQQIFGLILILFGLAAALPSRLMKRAKWMYTFILPSIVLIIHSVASTIKAAYVPEQFIEHALQMALPIILIYVVIGERFTVARLYNVMAIFVALTFIGHGLFAVGWHYVPANFIEMTTKSLHLETSSALQFLFIMGCLDFIFVVLAFIPKIRRYAIWYLIVWGILTSLARTYYMLDIGLTADFIGVNIPNTIYRLPHGLVPMIMLMLAYKMDVKYSRQKGQLEA